MSAARDYFYITFNYRLKRTGTLKGGSLVSFFSFFCQAPVIESRYLVLNIAELRKDGQLALTLSSNSGSKKIRGLILTEMLDATCFRFEKK